MKVGCVWGGVWSRSAGVGSGGSAGVWSVVKGGVGEAGREGVRCGGRGAAGGEREEGGGGGGGRVGTGGRRV